MTEIAPNTILYCNICNKKIGEVCLMSPDFSASDSFLNQSREHFKKEHGMEPNKDGQQGL